jgi:Arc/MetJ-type ribon-helix-helix transcriptional regulator
MAIRLNETQEKKIQDCLASGHFSSESDVLDRALDLVTEELTSSAEDQAAVDRAEAQAERGEVIPLDEYERIARSKYKF